MSYGFMLPVLLVCTALGGLVHAPNTYAGQCTCQDDTSVVIGLTRAEVMGVNRIFSIHRDHAIQFHMTTGDLQGAPALTSYALVHQGVA